MGLRLVAHYLEPIEASIASSAVDAAGIPCFVHGFQLVSIQPDYTFAFGGYRLFVCDEDFAAALDVLAEAKANPLKEGEHYESRASLADRLPSPLVGWLAGGVALPLRSGVWRDTA